MCKPTMIAYAHTHIYTYTEDNQLISPFYALQHLSLPYCRVQNIPAHLNEPTAAPGPEEMSYMQHMIPRPTPITLPIRLLNDNAADGPQPMDIDQPSPVQSMIPPHRERFHRRGGVSLPSGTGAALDGNTPFETVTVTMRIEITLRRPPPQQPVFRFSQEAARTGVVGYHDPQTEVRSSPPPPLTSPPIFLSFLRRGEGDRDVP